MSRFLQGPRECLPHFSFQYRLSSIFSVKPLAGSSKSKEILLYGLSILKNGVEAGSRLCGNLCPWIARSTRRERMDPKYTTKPPHFRLQALSGLKCSVLTPGLASFGLDLELPQKPTVGAQRLQPRLKFPARDPQMRVLFPLLPTLPEIKHWRGIKKQTAPTICIN